MTALYYISAPRSTADVIRYDCDEEDGDDGSEHDPGGFVEVVFHGYGSVPIVGAYVRRGSLMRRQRVPLLMMSKKLFAGSRVVVTSIAPVGGGVSVYARIGFGVPSSMLHGPGAVASMIRIPSALSVVTWRVEASLRPTLPTGKSSMAPGSAPMIPEALAQPTDGQRRAEMNVTLVAKKYAMVVGSVVVSMATESCATFVVQTRTFDMTSGAAVQPAKAPLI